MIDWCECHWTVCAIPFQVICVCVFGLIETDEGCFILSLDHNFGECILSNEIQIVDKDWYIARNKPRIEC